MKNQLNHKKRDLEPQSSELKTLLECFQNKQYDDAEKLALSLTERFKIHPFGWKVLGAVFNQTGRLTEALDACQKSVELDPKNAENHNNLGNVFHKLGQLEDAEKSYNKVIVLKPENASAYNSLGNIFHKYGKLDEAKKNYKKSITLKPDFAIAYNNLGVVFKKLGKEKEAKKCFNITINLKPNFNEALINKGQLLFENDEFKKALIELGANKEDIDEIITNAEENEKNSNQILDFTKEIKNLD